MKYTTTQPVINVARSLLNLEGWAKDFGDFYDAGRALSEWPAISTFTTQPTVEEYRAITKTQVEWEVDEKARAVCKKALDHYVSLKKPVTEYHYQLCVLLDIKP